MLSTWHITGGGKLITWLKYSVRYLHCNDYCMCGLFFFTPFLYYIFRREAIHTIYTYSLRVENLQKLIGIFYTDLSTQLINLLKYLFILVLIYKYLLFGFNPVLFYFIVQFFFSFGHRSFCSCLLCPFDITTKFVVSQIFFSFLGKGWLLLGGTTR